jgi:hypothetical protein
MGHETCKMDKSAILKVRVTDNVQADFLAVCKALGRTPAAVLRELIEKCVAAHSINLEDDVRVTVERPVGYEYGVWRVRMTLRSPQAMEFMGAPVPFSLPKLEARRVHPDKGNCVATTAWDKKGSGLDGIFVNGIWEGNIYTNGVEEDKNPTPLNAVIDALRAAVRDRVQAMTLGGANQ